MDNRYYFVMEPDGVDDGPYRLHEIQRRVEIGLISRSASLCRVGETTYVPLTDPRYTELLEPPRAASGTMPPPVDKVDPLRATIAVEPPTPKLAPPAVAAMPPGFVPPVPAMTVSSLPPPIPAPVPFAPVPTSTPSVGAWTPSAPAIPTVTARFGGTATMLSTPAPTPIAPPMQTSMPPAVPPMPSSAAPPIATPAIREDEAPSSTTGSVASVPTAPVFAPPLRPSQASDGVPGSASAVGSAPVAAPVAAQRVMAMAQKLAKSMPAATQAPVLEPLPAPAPPVHPPEPLPEPLVADSSAQSPMPTAPPMAIQLYSAVPHYDSAYQPPMYEQPVYDHHNQPDSTAQTPRITLAWWKARRVWAIAGGGLVLLVVIIAVAATRGGEPTSAKHAMVRVTTPSATGAGFFIAGPDHYAYVVTANHVVDRGERVLVERDVGEDKQSFVEAYPETEIVAADPDADLAIIRIKNVDAARFPILPLATQPMKDEKILSYGYPGSSLATKTGLVSKDGKVLSLVSFPAYDERYQRVLRDNAVDGLLISTDIEPGMSGGPTTNEADEVVGVNVTKDRAHVGQNGAVSVVALRGLLAKVKPASERPQPTTDDVVKLLEEIQSNYLLLPLDERKKVRETELVFSGDLPALRQLVNEVRREERNTDTSFIAKYRLSGQAALGIFFARMPGKLLETYRAPSTTGPLAACELANRRLISFLGDLSTADKRIESPGAKLASCDELAVRPLAWDLVAATMQWEGKEQRYTVTKLDKLDEDGKLYRASVRIAGTSHLIELWLGMDRHAVRLKLFDPTGSLYAIKSPRNVPASVLQGTWSMKRPRVTDAINKHAEIESTETLSISINDNKVSIRHVVKELYFGAGNRAQVFKCNAKRTIETGLLQSFSGTLENGVIVGLPDKDAEPFGLDAAWCLSSHRADRIIAIKPEGDQLLVYRTDGNAYPEAIQLARDKDVVAPAPATTPSSSQR